VAAAAGRRASQLKLDGELSPRQAAQLAPEITQVIDLVAEIPLAERRRQLSTDRACAPESTEQEAARLHIRDCV
jgi:hypothetical protein